MPITSSAKKALRVSRRKRVINLVRKTALSRALKQFKKLVAEKKAAEATAFFSKLQKEIDKSAKRGIIKKNNASRKKSRFSAMLRKIS